jgi:hypothetical protein
MVAATPTVRCTAADGHATTALVARAAACVLRLEHVDDAIDHAVVILYDVLAAAKI